MNPVRLGLGAVSCILMLIVGCGSDSTTSAVATTTTRGTLVENPPFRIASLSATDFQAQIASQGASGAQLLQLTGAPVCGVDFNYLKYWTVDPAGNAIMDTAALMVPTGAAAQCTGARPIVLYAHGTDALQTDNIADITNTNDHEIALIAAMFAAQGYIVVAPNYAGYDASTLKYHPFLDGDQQSKDMIDALTAGRSALGHILATSISDNGKLFVTGVSEGGYVAMATQRAMEAAKPGSVTAAAPISGPYALEWFADAVVCGQVNIGSTEFAPLLLTSYQHSYPSAPLYTATTDIYSSNYATGIDTLLPSATPFATLIATGKVPQTFLFDSTPPASNTGNQVLDAHVNACLTPNATPPFSYGFAPAGTQGLLNDAFRVAYATDAMINVDGAIAGASGVPLAATPGNNLRKGLNLNDMRQWKLPNGPEAPMLMCGGDQDPTVFFNNATIMQSYWGLPAPLINVLDVNQSIQAGDSASTQALKAGFAAAVAATSQAAGGGAAGQAAVVASYHGSLVPPFCMAAARGFFANF